MTTTTHYAAIDTSYTGTIYGIGVTREAALAEALSVGDPASRFVIVPCSEAAYAYVEMHGGAPSHDLVVCDRGPTCDDPRTGVWLRSEEE